MVSVSCFLTTNTFQSIKPTKPIFTFNLTQFPLSGHLVFRRSVRSLFFTVRFESQTVDPSTLTDHLCDIERANVLDVDTTFAKKNTFPGL